MKWMKILHKLAHTQFGRSESFPSQYSMHSTSVPIDMTMTVLIAIFVIIFLAYLSIIPSYRKKQSIYVTIKVSFSITIGCLLIVENFGQEWEYGSTKSKMSYRVGMKLTEIDAQMAVKIGFRSVYIMLKDKPKEDMAKETINYNERFPWTWDQGRVGFGPNAGLLQRTFRDGQRKGLPAPILWVAEYFVIDGEDIRFGRFYRTAGWYCHILLWTAFACWILANIFLLSMPRYVAYLTGLIGGLQWLACVVWISIRNPLVIPFEDGVIKMALSTHFWMTFGCGLVSIILAGVLLFMDLRHPNALSNFLGIDPLGQYDECVIRSSQVNDVLCTKIHMDGWIEMTSTSAIPENSDTGMQIVLKRRSTIQNAQKSLFRAPVHMKMETYDDNAAVYENQDVAGSSASAFSPGTHNEEKKKAKPPPVPRKTRTKDRL